MMKAGTKKFWKWAIPILAVLWIIGAIFGGDDDAEPVAETTLQEQAQQQANESGQSVTMVNMDTGEEVTAEPATAEPARCQQAETGLEKTQRELKNQRFVRVCVWMANAYSDKSIVARVDLDPHMDTRITVITGSGWQNVTQSVQLQSLGLWLEGWEKLNSPNSVELVVEDAMGNKIGGSNFWGGVYCD